MSYDGRIDFGLVADYDALPDLDDLAAALDDGDRRAGRGRGGERGPPRAPRTGRAARLTGSSWPARWHRSRSRSPRSTPGSATSRATRGSREQIERARDAGAELVLFPELVLTGYPPEDLLLKEHFLQAAQEALREVARGRRGHRGAGRLPGARRRRLQRAGRARGREVAAVYRKTRLPNYGVFDEQRYFQAGDDAVVLDIGGARIGLTICEDIWTPGHPAAEEALAGATLIVNASASPYFAGKGRQRERMLVQRARDNLCAVAFCNLVGGQDELVFDGHSVVIDHEGTVLARAPQFAEALTLARSTCRPRPPRGCATRGCARRCAARCPRCATLGALERAAAPRRGRSAATSRRCSSPRRRSTPRSARRARLRREERLRARRARPVGRDRLDARGADRRRRARAPTA